MEQEERIFKVEVLMMLMIHYSINYLNYLKKLWFTLLTIIIKKNSTIENEKNNNPRLQVSSKEEYADIMNNLNLSNPKMMDIAVPANLKGLTLDQL